MGWLPAALDKRAHRPVLPKRVEARWLSRLSLSPELQDRLERIEVDDVGGHGFDPFGLSRNGVGFALALTRPLYETWFRVTAHHIDRVPASGPAIVAVNHSGFLPLDAMMVVSNLMREGPEGRIPRGVADRFVPNLPWVNLLFQRAGVIAGSRGNFHAILDRGGLLVVFPEGTPGIGKGFQNRYQLQPFRPGHAELAIRHQAAVVPTAVVGAEEAWAQIARIDGLKLFGSPYLPIPATPFPLPFRYHVWYGQPIDVARRFRPEQSDDAETVDALAREVQGQVQELIDEGRRDRAGWLL